MKAEMILPDDLFGLSIEEVKQAVKGTKARITNKDYSYDLLTKFKIKAIGRLKIVGPSKKSVDKAWFWIKEKARQKLDPVNVPSR
jgi:hypothetical protein